MTLVLNLPAELESRLRESAVAYGLSLQDYTLRLLSEAHLDSTQRMSGEEIIAFWHKEGVIGSRNDISDSQAHSRQLRERAQTRTSK